MADSNFFLRILCWRISSYNNSVLFNYIPLELSNKNTMSPALGTNGGRSKSITVFMHFCIECNGKSLKFDTIAKIKVIKEIKTGCHCSYKRMGAVPKVRIGDKILFLSRSLTLKRNPCKI